jgi:hypothetical protein
MSKSNGLVESDHSEVAALITKMGAFLRAQQVAPKVTRRKKSKEEKKGGK